MKRIGAYILILCSLTFCSEKKNNGQNIESKLSSQKSECDSIYMGFFHTDSILNSNPILDFNKITSMDTLEKIYNSNRGFFNIHFDELLPSEPEMLSARYVHYDSLRSKLYPRVGMPAYYTYEFEFTPDLKYAYCYNFAGNQKVFRRKDLFNIIDSLLTKEFLGDSISLRKLYTLKFTYPVPPTLDEFKDLTQQRRRIQFNILNRICNKYSSDNTSLIFRLWRLAHLGVYLNYDFCAVPWWQSEDLITQMDSLKEGSNIEE